MALVFFEETEKFINIQLEMLKDDFSLSQIQDNVYRYVFKKLPNFTINALIIQCMELYAEIILRQNK